MNFGDELSKDQQERFDNIEQQRRKCGDYTVDDCPNCGRHRVMRGEDGKRRCETCCWCIEDSDYDFAFVSYMNNLS